MPCAPCPRLSAHSCWCRAAAAHSQPLARQPRTRRCVAMAAAAPLARRTPSHKRVHASRPPSFSFPAGAQVASLLLERRADVSLLDSSGETAREKAMERGHTAVLQLLTQAAAAVTATPSAHAPPQPPDSSGPPSGGAAPRPAAVAPAADQSVSTLLDELGTELARAAASMPPGERAKLAASLSLVAAAKAAAARSAL